jgi:hypothetical protein
VLLDVKQVACQVSGYFFSIGWNPQRQPLPSLGAIGFVCMRAQATREVKARGVIPILTGRRRVSPGLQTVVVRVANSGSRSKRFDRRAIYTSYWTVSDMTSVKRLSARSMNSLFMCDSSPRIL